MIALLDIVGDRFIEIEPDYKGPKKWREAIERWAATRRYTYGLQSIEAKAEREHILIRLHFPYMYGEFRITRAELSSFTKPTPNRKNKA